VLHPGKMLAGTFAMAAAGGAFYAFTNNQQPASDFKKNHPFIFICLVITLAYFFVYMVGSVAVFLLGILLPLVGKFYFEWNILLRL